MKWGKQLVGAPPSSRFLEAAPAFSCFDNVEMQRSDLANVVFTIHSIQSEAKLQWFEYVMTARIIKGFREGLRVSIVLPRLGTGKYYPEGLRVTEIPIVLLPRPLVSPSNRR